MDCKHILKFKTFQIFLLLAFFCKHLSSIKLQKSFCCLPDVAPLGACAIRIEPCEESRSRGGATRLGVVPGWRVMLYLLIRNRDVNRCFFFKSVLFCNDHSRVEDDALISELLQRGRVHLHIVPGDVVEAEVVCEQHQEVWLPRRLVEE